MRSYRLASAGLVDRAAPRRFSFDGKTYMGFAGDTLASALLANGVTLMGRSFKYHRPRGVMTAGPEEPNALVELRSGARQEPNTKATTVELFDGLTARSQNRFPSLAFDLMAVTSLASPIFVAGFYYKTFMWPRAFWEKLYEPAIRRAAGLGRASRLPDPDSYEKANGFCDVLVIGGGPAGLATALAAGAAGARVILADDDFVLGGRLNAERVDLDGMSGQDWARRAVAQLAAMANVTVMGRTSVFGLYDGDTFGALERVGDHLAEPQPFQPRQRLWKIVARRTILASGSIERPIVFGGNDRPGVMLASAVRSYLNRFGVAPGQCATIFTATDDGWRTAADLMAAGVAVAAVIDSRAQVDDALTDALSGQTARYLGATVTGTSGRLGLNAITVRQANGSTVSVVTDLLAVSGGFNPAIGLATHLGQAPEWSEVHKAFLMRQLPAGLALAGAAAGTFDTASCLAEGHRQGASAAAALGFGVQPDKRPVPAQAEPTGVGACFAIANSAGKAFVDFQNDVTRKDIALSVREGFTAVEHLKRYTTLGMATDQGKLSNVTGLAIMAELTGRSISEVGTTRSRPPQTPVALGALAGMHRGKDFKPTRLTAAHDWAAGRGASFVETGQWLRAQWFARPGEADWLATVSREVNAVRSAVGICDVSTLGKIALSGADVGIFLDRVYANMFSTLAVGKARYGLMLREDGFVMDDGTTARLTELDYVMSTTTVNAAKVMQHLQFCHQVLWPELNVAMTSVTEHWAQFAVAGPRSRELLANLFGDALDVSNAAIPYLGVIETRLRGVPARLFRISFSGELAYEIAVPARYGAALAEALMTAGRPCGVVPYGTEALGVMRIEKGHVAGNELNGQTVARDLGLSKMMSTKKDYVGRLMAQRPALIDPDRPSLAGFIAVDPGQRLRAGAHFLGIGVSPSPDADQGYMTSVAYSPSLERWIGLGLISGGCSRIGERVRGYDPIRQGDIALDIVSPVFLDPAGVQLHG